jgi:hypothetical protein
MIRLYRLTTGEDVIGTPVKEDTTDSLQAIKKPFVLIPMQGQPGKPMQIGFHPYIPYTKDEVIKIKKNNIIVETTPDNNMMDAYERNTSSLVTPKKSIITH